MEISQERSDSRALHISEQTTPAGRDAAPSLCGSVTKLASLTNLVKAWLIQTRPEMCKDVNSTAMCAI